MALVGEHCAETLPAAGIVQSPGAEPSWWRRGMNVATPGPVAGGMFLCGFLVETGLHASFGGVRPGWSWLAAALSWTWLTAMWCVWGLSRATDAAGNRRPLRWLGLVVVVAITELFLFVQVCSWVIYRRTGQFGGVDALDFAWHNVAEPEFWGYMASSELPTLWRFAAVAALIMLALPRLLRILSQSSWRITAGRRTWQMRIAVWLVAGMGCLLLGLSTGRELSRPRRELALSLLRYRTNPVVTCLSGIQEFWELKPISPCLVDANLVPLTEKPTDPPALKATPSVVMIAIESLRHDVIHQVHQGREVTPQINAIFKDGRHFTQAYAQSTHSDYSDVAVLCSLYPLRARRHHFYSRRDPWPVVRIYDALKPAGYATAHISSQNESWGGMDQLLASPNLDLLYDADHSHAAKLLSRRDTGLAYAIAAGQIRNGKLDDAHTVDVAIDWVRKQASAGKPFYLSMNLQYSHFPYELPATVAHPFQPCEIDFEASFIRYPEEKTEVVRNAYFNALHAADEEVGRLVRVLRELNRLDDTLLVIYGDNGESFHEHGAVTHAREPYEPAIHIACGMRAPGWVSPGTDDYPCELIDLPPTILGLLGLSRQPNFQGIDLFAHDRPAVDRRQIFLHVESALAQADAVVRAGRWKFMHDRRTGREYLFDLKTDPREVRNVASQELEWAAQLRETLAEWRNRQLAYYYYPFYYRKYYPPAPPGCSAQPAAPTTLVQRAESRDGR